MQTAQTALKVALVDDHELFRYSLGAVLHERGFEMVAQAGDARAGFAAIDRARPDVVLLDVELPGMDGVTAARELLARPSRPKVLMLSAHNRPHLVTAAFDAGAHGYASKSSSIDELVSGIRMVAEGKRYLAPGLSPLATCANGPLAALSPREREVFRLLVLGRSMPALAKELCISIKTLETHRQHIFKKLNLHSAVQLVRFAVVNDLFIERTVVVDAGAASAPVSKTP